MFKNHWLLSLIACAGLCHTALPVRGQALTPYVPSLDAEKLEQRGLELAENAVQLVRFQQYDAALSQAKLATQLAPNRYPTWFILGTLYLQQEKIDEGIAALDQALAIEPEESGIWFTLGNAYFQKEDYNKAISHLEAGLEFKSDVPAAFFDLGNSHLKLGQFSEAIASYEEAVTLESKFWPAINNIGLVYYEQGNLDKAIDRWDAAIELDKEQAEPRLARAVALLCSRSTRRRPIKEGIDALTIDIRYADLAFLEENLWGEKLLKDTESISGNPADKSHD